MFLSFFFSPQLRLGMGLKIRLSKLLSLRDNTCTTRFNNKSRSLVQTAYLCVPYDSHNKQHPDHTFIQHSKGQRHTIFLHYMAVLLLPTLNTLSNCVTFINPFKLHLLKQIFTISTTRAVSANKLSDVQIIWHQLIATFQYCILWSCIYTMNPRNWETVKKVTEKQEICDANTSSNTS